MAKKKSTSRKRKTSLEESDRSSPETSSEALDRSFGLDGDISEASFEGPSGRFVATLPLGTAKIHVGELGAIAQ